MSFVEVLPAINASFNATSAALLLAGFVAIRQRRVRWHVGFMLAALVSSTLFLVGYLWRMSLTGTHRFAGSGFTRMFYLTLLFSHMLLAIALLPFVFRLLYLAWRRRFSAHKATARWAWPAWMYVSVTGVVVYYMLYHWTV